MTSNFPSEKKIYKRVMKDMTKNRKIDDTKSFVHGQEGTHYACQEMLEKYGGKTQCCGCTGHKCNPSTPEPSEEWEEGLKLYLTSAGDRRRTVHFIKTLLAQREKELIEKLHKSMKQNLGIMFATPSDPYHINTKAYIKCCKWWEDTIYKTIDNLESTLSEAGEKREEVRE